MKILHICLASSFTEGMAYQENLLAAQNIKDGHNVTIISNCHKFENGVMIQTDNEDKILPDGTRLIRLEYDMIINRIISRKVRKVSILKDIIMDIKPDIILFHGVTGWEILTVANYKKNNPNVKLYIDSHSDKNNSASNWVSLNLLHKLFYRTIINKTISYFDKILYVSYEAKYFLKEMYNIPDELMEFFPLGGTILNERHKKNYREEKRKELGISQESIVLCHSGKMDIKKRTYEILENFQKVNDKNIKLILIGVFTKDVERRVMPLIREDNRVIYLGWKNSAELIKYISASDLYLQPGSQSATMQNALCAGTPVLFKNVKSHEAYNEGNAFAINNYEEMEAIFHKISMNPDILKEMSIKAFLLARELLDYKKLANRITK